MAEITTNIKTVPYINESTSLIENKQEALNSSASMKSINSCIKLLTEVKKTNTKLINPKQSKKPLKSIAFPHYYPNSYRGVLTKDITKNPFISPTIKSKINEIMKGVNTKKQSYLSLYKWNPSKSNPIKYNCKTSSSTVSLINKTSKKLSFRQEASSFFTKPPQSQSLSNKAMIDLSNNQSKEILMTNSNSNRKVSLFTSPGYKSSSTSSSTASCAILNKNKSDISQIKKKLYEKYQKDIDELEKKLDIGGAPKKKKTWKYDNLFVHKSDFSKNKSLQFLKTRSFISKSKLIY